MKTEQIVIRNDRNVDSTIANSAIANPNLVLAFGSPDFFASGTFVTAIHKKWPKAQVFGCSTAGEISEKGVTDKALILNALQFDSTSLKLAQADIAGMHDSFEAGKRLAQKIPLEGLKTVFLLGRGLDINGSAVIEGLRSVLGSVPVTGGLAGDDGAFKRTFTVLGNQVADDKIIACGFYGDKFTVGYGSMGGWEPFGPVRRVTKSENNVMYELDGEPALNLYKKYLGDQAAQLPASGLLYPFAILKNNQDTTGLIRTILAVDEATGSLTFAGDIPQGGIVRLMQSKSQGLVEGARGAANLAKTAKNAGDSLGILISCVGRKLVMGNDIEDEVEAVRSVFGENTLTGFYSYGEICAENGFAECQLHNQTMTITYISEAA